MKLLVLTNNLKRASFRQRIGIYIDYLRTKGIDCTVFQLPKNSISRWKLFRSSADFDGIWLHKKALNFFDSRILRKYGKKIIYDFDDAVMFSPHTPQSNKSSHFRLFKRTVKLADLIIAGNEYLANQANSFNDNVIIIPTALRLDSYKINMNKPNDDKIRLVWIGSKATLKYLADIKLVLEALGEKYKNVVLRIIADDFIDLENMPVEKHHWSKETEIKDLCECDIGLSPLPDNRFTRGKCGFKILQYFAASLPVIASGVGVNKKFIDESHAGFTAESFDEWIQKLSELITDGDTTIKLGQNGRDYVRNYDQKVIRQKLLSYLESFVKAAQRNAQGQLV